MNYVDPLLSIPILFTKHPVPKKQVIDLHYRL